MGFHPSMPIIEEFPRHGFLMLDERSDEELAVGGKGAHPNVRSAKQDLGVHWADRRYSVEVRT